MLVRHHAVMQTCTASNSCRPRATTRQVTGIRFIDDKACGKSRGMAIVDFAEADAARQCITGLHGCGAAAGLVVVCCNAVFAWLGAACACQCCSNAAPRASPPLQARHQWAGVPRDAPAAAQPAGGQQQSSRLRQRPRRGQQRRLWRRTRRRRARRAWRAARRAAGRQRHDGSGSGQHARGGHAAGHDGPWHDARRHDG